MVAIQTPGNSVDYAAERLGVFTGEKPKLIQTGIVGFDRDIGGVAPGFITIIGAGTGLGKSNLILDSVHNTTTKVGILSCEDTPEVWGTRLLARHSGVNSLKIRKGELTQDERKRLGAAKEAVCNLHNFVIAYTIGAGLNRILDATEELVDAGCELIWLDYLQKIKGPGDRRQTVGDSYTKFQELCYINNVAPVVVSQFSRRQVKDGHEYRPATLCDKPDLSWLKESGDIEIEAREVLLGYRDWHDHKLVRWWLAKSTIGGAGSEYLYRYNEAGVCVPHSRISEGEPF